MNERWWERPVWIICDYWWIFLIVIIIGLSLFFTRCYWFKGLCSNSPGFETDILQEEIPNLESGLDTPNVDEKKVTSTPISTQELQTTSTFEDPIIWLKYKNVDNKYELSYPSTWHGVEYKQRVTFDTPYGNHIEIIINPVPEGTDPLKYVETQFDQGEFTDIKSEQQTTNYISWIVSNFEDVEAQARIISYDAIFNNQSYRLLFYIPTNESDENITTDQEDFKQVVNSFTFSDGE